VPPSPPAIEFLARLVRPSITRGDRVRLGVAEQPRQPQIQLRFSSNLARKRISNDQAGGCHTKARASVTTAQREAAARRTGSLLSHAAWQPAVSASGGGARAAQMARGRVVGTRRGPSASGGGLRARRMARGRGWCNRLCRAAVVRGNCSPRFSSLVLLRAVSAPPVGLAWALDYQPGNVARRPAPRATTSQDGVAKSIAEHSA
jgi:hypothetical protein